MAIVVLGLTVWFSIKAGTSELYDIVNASNKFLIGMLFMALMLILYIVVGLLLWVFANKCLVKIAFTFISTITVIMFWACGILLIVAQFGARHAIDVACGDSDIDLSSYVQGYSDMFKNMYDEALEVFGTATCPIDADWADRPGGYTYDTDDGFKALQYCTDGLEEIYDDLDIEDVFDLTSDPDTYSDDEKEEHAEDNPDDPPLPDNENLE